MATAIQKYLYGDESNPYRSALSPMSAEIRPLTAPSLRVPLTPTKVATGTAQPQPAAAPMAPPTTTAPAATPAAPAWDPSVLAKWGYTGDLGINDLERQYLEGVAQNYQSGGGMNDLAPAGDYYRKVLSGAFGPEGEAYLQSVLDPMRASSMQNYDELSKALANRFSQFGGYYGGKAGVAQGRLASDTARDMASQEANLRYQRFMDNINAMGGAASGLTGLAGTRQSMLDDLLNGLRSGGDLMTGRSTYNAEQLQSAIAKEYQDYLRARQEQLLPLSLAQALLGTNAQDTVVTQTPGILNTILGGIGDIGSAAAYKMIK